MSDERLSNDKIERDNQKHENVRRAESDLSWLFDGDMKVQYTNWLNKIPDIVPKIQ